MNAGAHGSEIKDVLVKTICLDENGEIIELSNKEQEFSYRKSIFEEKKYIILETELQLREDNVQDIENRMNEMLEIRKEKQPIEYPSAGSTFKRNPNAVTAKLIDEAGLKCFSIGGASVSEKHAGFIINNNNATADDIIKLIKYTKDVIKEKFGKVIQTEIIIIGE